MKENNINIIHAVDQDRVIGMASAHVSAEETFLCRSGFIRERDIFANKFAPTGKAAIERDKFAPTGLAKIFFQLICTRKLKKTQYKSGPRQSDSEVAIGFCNN